MTPDRFALILDAYERALGGQDASQVNIWEIVPRIVATVRGVSTEEIAEALRWDAQQKEREAEDLLRYAYAHFENVGKLVKPLDIAGE